VADAMKPAGLPLRMTLNRHDRHTKPPFHRKSIRTSQLSTALNSVQHLH
jgi:hypothetical protein